MEPKQTSQLFDKLPGEKVVEDLFKAAEVGDVKALQDVLNLNKDDYPNEDDFLKAMKIARVKGHKDFVKMLMDNVGPLMEQARINHYAKICEANAGQSESKSKCIKEGLESHIENYLSKRFGIVGNLKMDESDGDEVSPLKIVIQTNPKELGLDQIAYSLANDVLTKRAWFKVIDSKTGDESDVNRGRTALFGKKSASITEDKKEMKAIEDLSKADQDKVVKAQVVIMKTNPAVEPELGMAKAEARKILQELGVDFTGIEHQSPTPAKE